MLVRELPVQERPRERLEKHGVAALSTAELLAVVLQKGSKEQSVVEMCYHLLQLFPLNTLQKCSVRELQTVRGIGKAKAMQILALVELGKRMQVVQREGKQIMKAEDVFSLLAPTFSHLQKEHVVVLCLDSKNKVIQQKVVFIGSLNMSVIHPREIFFEAIKEGANAIIVAHNHPSGDVSPSKEDDTVTMQLVRSGGLLGIPVLDHVIVGKETFYSYCEEKRM